MKHFLLCNVILCLLLFTNCSCNETDPIAVPADMNKIQEIAQKAYTYCKNNKRNTDFFILIDLSVHSGLKRFFIWDFNTQSISHSFLVSHGCCNSPWGGDGSKDKAIVSNEHGSHCSSVGKYLIGERGFSNWGINVKYLLHGLESSNNNALGRQIVLHGWNMVSDEEVFPSGTPEGWGCPAISNNSMRIVDKKLKNASKKTLLWIIKD